jgi:hypothetical protein
VVKRWLAVLDSPGTAPHCVSARAESTGLSVQDPFTRSRAFPLTRSFSVFLHHL